MFASKFNFPSIRFSEKYICFNSCCEELRGARTIVVSKAGDKVIFRPSQGLDGFRVSTRKNAKYFTIPSTAIRYLARIGPGAQYRLHRMDCGAWFIKINEPLGV